MSNKPLTVNQRKFADKYIETGNARAAYNFAYPGKRSDNVTDANASRLLSNVKVSSYITQTQAELQKSQAISIERIVAKLAREAFGADLEDVAEVDSTGKVKLKAGADLGGVDAISFSETHGNESSSRSLSVKRKDKLKALDLLMKTLGIGPYAKNESGDPGRVFNDNAGRVLDALKGVRGKKGS